MGIDVRNIDNESDTPTAAGEIPSTDRGNIEFPVATTTNTTLYKMSMANLLSHLNSNITFPTPAGFDLHDDVTAMLGSLDADDRILVSAESVAGDPNRYTTLAILGAFVKSNHGFDLYDDVGTSVSGLQNTDRMLVADVSTSGNDNRYVTVSNLRTSILALGNLSTSAPSLAGADVFALTSDDDDTTYGVSLTTLQSYMQDNLTFTTDTNTDNYVSGGSVSGTTLTLERTGSLADITITGLPSAGTAFDLHEDTDTEMTAPATADRLVISDESETGEPNRYLTLTRLVTFMQSNLTFTTNTDDYVTGGSVSGTTLTLTRNTGGDISITGLPSGGTAFDLYEDADTESSTLEDDDRLVVADVSETGEPNRYTTLQSLTEHISTSDNVLLAIKDFDEDQIDTAHLALSIVGGISSFSAEGTHSTHTTNNHMDGGAYISSVDEVWIADNNDNAIYRYEPDGTLLVAFNADSSNQSPTGVAYIESIDEVWIIQDANIHRYRTNRTYISAYDSGFTSNALIGIGYDSTRDRVLVLNDTADTLYYYNTDGTYANESMSLDSNQDDPSGVTYYKPLDEYWIADRVDNSIYRYSAEDGTLVSTESLATANNDARFVAHIASDSVDEIWVGQNNSSNIYRYSMAVGIDQDKLVEAFENASSSQLGDVRDALNVPNVRVVENDEVSYTDDHTIVISGEEAQVNDIIIFQYRRDFTASSDNVTVNVGSDGDRQVRILSESLGLRFLTLNDMTRYALYMMMRVDGNLWQYIGGTRNTPGFVTGGSVSGTTLTLNRSGTLSDLTITGLPSGGGFDLHDDVSTELLSLASADRFVVSDESESGDPNRYVTLSTLQSYMQSNLTFTTNTDDYVTGGSVSGTTLTLTRNTGGDISITGLPSGGSGFDLHDDVGTALSSLASDDRFVVSDESASGDPNRYITLSTLQSYLQSNLTFTTNTDRYVTGGSVSGTTLTLTRNTGGSINITGLPSGGSGFDLHDDVGTELTSLSSSDRMLISDEGTAGDPNRYMTLSRLQSYMQSNLTFTTNTNYYVTSGSVSGTTLTLNRSGLASIQITGLPSGGGNFDLHDDVTTELTSLASSDRMLVSDEGTAGDPNRYMTISRLQSYLQSNLTFTTSGRVTAISSFNQSIPGNGTRTFTQSGADYYIGWANAREANADGYRVNGTGSSVTVTNAESGAVSWVVWFFTES